MPKSAAFRSDLLGLFFNGVPIDGIADPVGTTLVVAAHTADPGEAGTQLTSEADYEGYARVVTQRTTANWANGTPTVMRPSTPILWPACTGGPGNTLTHYSVGIPGTDKIMYSGSLGSSSLLILPGMVPVLNIGGTAITEGGLIADARGGQCFCTSTVTGAGTSFFTEFVASMGVAQAGVSYMAAVGTTSGLAADVGVGMATGTSSVVSLGPVLSVGSPDNVVVVMAMGETVYTFD